MTAAAASGLGVLLDAVRTVTGCAFTASDDELLADLARIEAVGRIVDSLRVLGRTTATASRRMSRNRATRTGW